MVRVNVNGDLRLVSRNHPLSGVYAKIDRAEKHLDEFKAIKKGFVDTKPLTFRHEVDSYTRLGHIFIKDIADPPLELSVIAGDIINNLRSSLDYLACQLVKLSFPSHTCARPHELYFPIRDSGEKLKEALNGEIKNAGPVAIRIFETLEGHKGGKRSDLWAINEISKKDKHRLSIIATASMNELILKTINVKNSKTLEREIRFTTNEALPTGIFHIFKSGDPVLGFDTSILVPNPGDELRVNVEAIGDVVFNEPGIVDTRPVVDVLVGFIYVIKDTVEQFQPLFP